MNFIDWRFFLRKWQKESLIKLNIEAKQYTKYEILRQLQSIEKIVYSDIALSAILLTLAI